MKRSSSKLYVYLQCMFSIERAAGVYTTAGWGNVTNVRNVPQVDLPVRLGLCKNTPLTRTEAVQRVHL
jgi:hypothetical protein